MITTARPAYRLEAEHARERAYALGVADGVLFTGRADRLPDHYRLASVYVTTSQHEGFCVPLVEAMASGVPVVAAASTAIPETLGDAGLLAPVDAHGVVGCGRDGRMPWHASWPIPLWPSDLRAAGTGTQRASSRVERYNERLDAIITAHCAHLPLRVQPAPYVQMAEAASESPAAAALPTEAVAKTPDVGRPTTEDEDLRRRPLLARTGRRSAQADAGLRGPQQAALWWAGWWHGCGAI